MNYQLPDLLPIRIGFEPTLIVLKPARAGGHHAALECPCAPHRSP